MKKLFAVLAIGLACTACTDPVTAQRALDNMGFTEIETQGRAFFSGCGESDNYATRFKARNPNGKIVTGVVCNGWFKGATVRFD
jgi:hypothetical protein